MKIGLHPGMKIGLHQVWKLAYKKLEVGLHQFYVLTNFKFGGYKLAYKKLKLAYIMVAWAARTFWTL